MQIKSNVVEEQKAKRAEYMNGNISHQDYYLWLANLIGANERHLPVSAARIKASTDEHFNDIPLKLWGRQDGLVRMLAGQAGLRFWSLSDTVCTLKVIARKVKGGSK